MLTSTLLALATAFGLALLHSLWIGAVLYVLVRAMLPVLGGPAARHNLAYGALLATFAGFAYAFYQVYDPTPVCENLLNGGLIYLGSPSALLTAGDAGGLEILRKQLPAFAPWLAVLYFSGLLPAVFLLLRDQRRVHRLSTVGIAAIPAGWATRLGAELASHPATRRARCYLSEQAGEVMTLGFWSPVIVFPVALVNELTPEMARTILLHEIAHLRHYDHWLNYPQQFLRTFFFFHPAVHGLCRIIDRAREHRCDDWVAARCHDRRTYATALVTVARSSHIPANNLVMSATKTPFSERIQRLFLGDDLRGDRKFAFSLLLLALLGLGHLGYTKLGATAGAVDCLEEQSKQAASRALAVKADSETALIVYRRSKLKRSANDPWVVTPPAPPQPCPSRLTVDDLPYIAAPEPPASTHPRAMESYERALRKYDNIRQYGQQNNATSRQAAGIDFMLKPGAQAVPKPCPSLKTPARWAPAFPDDGHPLTSARITFDNDQVSVVISGKKRAKIEGKKLAYFIDGKRTPIKNLSVLDQSAIATIEVVKDHAKLKDLGVGCYDGALIIASKTGEKVATGLHFRADAKITG